MTPNWANNLRLLLGTVSLFWAIANTPNIFHAVIHNMKLRDSYNLTTAGLWTLAFLMFFRVATIN